MTQVSDKAHAILINLWLDSNVTGMASTKERPYLLAEIQYLFDKLPKSFASEFSLETQQLSLWIANNTSQPLDKLDYQSDYYTKTIKKLLSKNIKIRYVVAFLDNSEKSEKVDVIRALYFFISLRLVSLSDYDSRVETTLNECRFLKTKTRHFLVQFLPDITHMNSLIDLLDWLKENQNGNHYNNWLNEDKEDIDLLLNKYFKQHDNLDDDAVRLVLINKKISTYFYEYILPIEYVLKGDSGITRTHNNENTYETVEGDKYIDEVTKNTVIDIAFTSGSSSEASAFEAQERQDDEELSHQAVSFSTPQNYYLDIVRAEQQVNCRHQRALSQVTDVNKAHSSDIKILVKALAAKLSNLNLRTNSDNETRLVARLSEVETVEYQSCLYLFILLLSGNSKAWASDELYQGYQTWTYRVEFRPTRSHIKENWNTSLCADNQDYLLLYLPLRIGQLYDCLINEDAEKTAKVIEKKASNILKNLNEEHGTKLTLHRITGYLSHYSNQEGHDQAVIDILTNQPISHLSSLPYFNISQLDLYMCQSQFNDHLLQLFDNDTVDKQSIKPFLEIVDDKATGYWDRKTGTALAVKTEEIKKVVSNLKFELAQLIELNSFNDMSAFVEKHNAFTDYLYLLLSISSGYRPVREPFGRLVHLDTRTGKYFISDKENHKFARGRFIYLPNITCEQIQCYVKYLTSQAKLLTRFGKDAANIYKNILDSHMGIITYLNYNVINGSVSQVELTQLYILERQKSLINLPLNWYRHYIRSYKPDTESGLYSLNQNSIYEPFGYDVIGAWMGHADALGFDFLDRYSGLSSSELKRFSNKLNDILVELGFECIALSREK